MAEALNHSTVLQFFTLDASNTNLGDHTGLAMEEALKHNTVLQSLTFMQAARTLVTAQV